MSGTHAIPERVSRVRAPWLRRVPGTAPTLGRLGRRAVDPLAGHVLSWGVAVLATALVTWLVVATRGAPNPLAHLYYLPILYASARHGWLGAVIAGTGAGLAAGPWMPTSSAATSHQSLDEWLFRLIIFVIVGMIAAWLTRQQPRPLDAMLRDVIVGQALRSAVRHHRIRVHYQPLVDLTDGRVVGVEALCRWYDSKARLVPPAHFIPVAERTGAIRAVGRDVMTQATRQADAWRSDAMPDLLVTVNVSAVQLGTPKFLAELTEAVQAGAQGTRLCVEITETAIMADPERALTTLRAARDLGVAVAIDDFGTGHSSLTYLTEFPIDIIKVDKSFIDDVDTDPKSRALVQAMVQMAHSLGVITIAEGIERREQAEVLRGLGCEIGQGYHFGRPSEPVHIDWTHRSLAQS